MAKAMSLYNESWTEITNGESHECCDECYRSAEKQAAAWV